MSIRADVIEALVARLSTATPAPVYRNDPLARAVPNDGLIVVHDGDPGEPDITLNPVIYAYRHRIDIEVFVPIAAGVGSDATIDALLDTLAGALAGDRDLGGLVETMTWVAPEISALTIEGGVPILVARLTIILEYLTGDPLAAA